VFLIYLHRPIRYSAVNFLRSLLDSETRRVGANYQESNQICIGEETKVRTEALGGWVRILVCLSSLRLFTF